MNSKSILRQLVFFILSFLIFFFLLNSLIPKKDPQLKSSDFLQKPLKDLNYLAIGDSLTEGVGDESGQGGYVSILEKDLESYYGSPVISANYGVAGNTSQQVLSRMQEDSSLKKELKKSDLITMTVGGNDILAVIRQNLAQLDRTSFLKPSKVYQKNLSEMISLAKKSNKEVRIYVLGLYNPFYLNFPEIREMQTIVDEWNQATKEVVSNYPNVYFVSINERLYKGIDENEGIVQSEGDKRRVLNDALFSGDHFHPNHIGYQIMSDTIMETIKKHEKKLRH